jgi:hypothetical protein
MTDKVVPFWRPEPLTADEQWLDRLIKDFGNLPVEGQLEVIFAACDTDALAKIAARLGESLNRDAPDPPKAA